MAEVTLEPLPVSLERPAFIKPWEVIHHEADKYGFKRTEYKFHSPLPNGVNSVIFTDPHDIYFTPSEKTIGITKGLESVARYVHDALKVNVPGELQSNDVLWTPIKRDVVESLVATSLFDQDGKQKYIEDNEGSALLLTSLAFRESAPEISQICFNELLDRRKYLPASEVHDVKDISAVHLGKIPMDKILSTHVTAFLPDITRNGVKIFPRIDADKIPRTTVHTYINGMVERHSQAGFNSASWEGQKYLVGMNFQELVKHNGLPGNFFKADTFWSMEPGVGLSMPEKSFMLVPSDEVTRMEPYKKAGIEIVGYDPNFETLREATKRYFSAHKIPFIENIDAKDPQQEDYNFAKKLGVEASSHYNRRKYYDSERFLLNSLDAIKIGEKYTTEGKGFLSWEDAEWIQLYGGQASRDQFKPKLVALARTLNNVRSALFIHMMEDKMPREFLTAASVAKLI